MMVSQYWLDRYFARAVERLLPSQHPELSERVRAYLRQGLKQLNALPGDDPFWINTNREPTVYKIGEYYGERYKAGSRDDKTLWTLIADRLLHCADNEMGDFFRPLLDRDFATMEWVIASGLWIYNNSGFSHTSSLRDLLREIRRDLPHLQDRLDGLRQGGTAHRLMMIDEALQLGSAKWAKLLGKRFRAASNWAFFVATNLA